MEPKSLTQCLADFSNDSKVPSRILKIAYTVMHGRTAAAYLLCRIHFFLLKENSLVGGNWTHMYLVGLVIV